MSRIVFGDAVVRWVAGRTSEYGNFGASTGIGVERDGSLIAGVVYADWNGVNCNMHVAALPRSGWLTRRGLWFWLDYPFNQLKVNRCTALIDQSNEAAQRLVNGVGFSYETRLAGACPGGDMLVFALWEKDCIWHKRKPPESELRRPSQAALDVADITSGYGVISGDGSMRPRVASDSIDIHGR